MLHPTNRAVVPETIIHSEPGNVSEPTAPSRRKGWRFWAGLCFVILVLAAFGQPLLALANYAGHSSLHSYILLIPFVSAYLLYIQRDQLPRKYVADLPLGMVFLASGLGVFLFTYWLNFAGRAMTGNY